MDPWGSVDSPIVLERLRATDETTRWVIAGVLLAVVVGVPLVISGPGNDLDVGNVFRSGRAIAYHLRYVPSRAPGAPVHELIVGVLDRIGGPVLTNLASVAAAVVLVVALDRLLRREGLGPARRWAVALFVANPWFLIAATSTTEYLFALGFVVLAALALRADRAVLTGLLAGAAMGCRVGSALLVASLFLAEITDPDRAARAAARRRVFVSACTAALATALVFTPSIIHAGGLSFAQNDFATSSIFVQLGRAAVKDLTLLGPVASLVLLATVPALWAAVSGWRVTWLVRFALPGFVLSQLLFIRFPWKMPHLLPCLLCLVILLAVGLQDRPKLLIALVVLQLLFAVVRVDVIEPDNPNQATGGRIHLGIGWGPVVRDWQCRREHPRAYLGRQKVEVEAAWDCAQPFHG